MINGSTVKVRVTRTGNIYTAPGASGGDVRPLVMGEKFLASIERGGRWAKLSTRNGRHIGFTKAKRLSTKVRGGLLNVLSDFWGYVDPKRKAVTRTYAQRGRFENAPTTPVKIGNDAKTVAPVAHEGHLVASSIVESLNELVEKVEKKEEAKLPEPSRSRFAFFDRFCALRESNHVSGETDHSVNLSTARYRFGATLVRWGVAGATAAYVAKSALAFLG